MSYSTTVLAEPFHCSRRRFREPEFERLNFAGWANKIREGRAQELMDFTKDALAPRS